MPITFPHKPGIIAYLTAGDPDLATTRDIVSALLTTAGVIQFGVPLRSESNKHRASRPLNERRNN